MHLQNHNGLKMTDKKSFFAELIERRVFQIMGMYVAAVWLAVEVSG